MHFEQDENRVSEVAKMLGGFIVITDEKLKRVWQMFTDAWKFYKKYADVQQNDEYWNAVTKESITIVKKYDNDRLCRDLILAALFELERKSKNSSENQRGGY